MSKHIAEAVAKKYGRPVRIRGSVALVRPDLSLVHTCGCGQAPSVLKRLVQVVTGQPTGTVRAKLDKGLRAFVGRCVACGHYCVTPLD